MKIRKNTQLSLLNLRRAGRPAIHDKGIRHTCRPLIKKSTPLHLTIKVRSNKADIQNKIILKALHRAIMRARIQGLKVLHYALEYNHVHLLIEADNNKLLHKGMQAFGITIAKAINKFKSNKGTVYKHRYHFRQISSLRDFKNVMNYIFQNGMKHHSSGKLINFYNSVIREKRLSRLYPNVEKTLWKEIKKSSQLRELYKTLLNLLDDNNYYLLSPHSAGPGKS